jgi:DNA-binding response OmpR family regulator
MTVATTHVLLLVEDNPDIRTMVAEWLREEGYTVIEAADGGAAIRSLREHNPPPDELCLVILDMMLPVSDGVSVLAALAGLGNYVPVVAMSADRGQLIRALNAGAQDVMQKPFDLDRLLAVVERNCGRRRPSATSPSSTMHSTSSPDIT